MKKVRGFTLIEMIIYVAVLGVILVGVISISLIVKTAQTKFISHRRVATDLSTALNNVDFLLRNSDGFVTDNSGKQCQDFEGTQGYNSYYLALFYSSSTAMSILPYECSGSFTATTTAVKIYWRDASHRGLWIDCYHGFANGESGNCTKVQSYGDTSFYFTSDKNTVIYNGGLIFATTTAYGSPALSTTLTLGLPNQGQLNFFSATTTASTTTAFRVKISNSPAPTEIICGDGVRQSSEICDSNLTTSCSGNNNYFTGGYVEDDSTCNSKTACKYDCSGCLDSATCTGSPCAVDGIYSGGYCYYLGAANQSCTTVCTTHGGCVAGALSDTSCTLLTELDANCGGGCGIGSLNAYHPSWDGGANCYYVGGRTYACATAPASGYHRLCRCAS
ncbi:MAG: prepilin-type N-terminal cleavage/methylation domain-containing protein [Candidatus Komeilibacteria bacterium]